MPDEDKTLTRQRKITKQRLKNIALYYLERFDTSAKNLKDVLERRVYKYARENPEFDRAEATAWIDEIVQEFEGYKYLDDARYADIKVKGYLAAGKSMYYIKNKMALKGIEESVTAGILDEAEVDEFDSAMRLAKKKKIGPFRVCSDEEQREFWQKDMGVLVRAGFSYDVAKQVLETNSN